MVVAWRCGGGSTDESQRKAVEESACAECSVPWIYRLPVQPNTTKTRKALLGNNVGPQSRRVKKDKVTLMYVVSRYPTDENNEHGWRPAIGTGWYDCSRYFISSSVNLTCNPAEDVVR